MINPHEQMKEKIRGRVQSTEYRGRIQFDHSVESWTTVDRYLVLFGVNTGQLICKCRSSCVVVSRILCDSIWPVRLWLYRSVTAPQTHTNTSQSFLRTNNATGYKPGLKLMSYERQPFCTYTLHRWVFKQFLCSVINCQNNCHDQFGLFICSVMLT